MHFVTSIIMRRDDALSTISIFVRPHLRYNIFLPYSANKNYEIYCFFFVLFSQFLSFSWPFVRSLEWLRATSPFRGAKQPKTKNKAKGRTMSCSLVSPFFPTSQTSLSLSTTRSFFDYFWDSSLRRWRNIWNNWREMVDFFLEVVGWSRIWLHTRALTVMILFIYVK